MGVGMGVGIMRAGVGWRGWGGGGRWGVGLGLGCWGGDEVLVSFAEEVREDELDGVSMVSVLEVLRNSGR